MEETLRITYMKCQFCTAKNHCAACGAELAEALAQKPEIAAAEVNLPDRTVRLNHSLDSDTLEDILDAVGLLVG